MRVIFPAETTREYRFLGLIGGRGLLWLGAGAYIAAQVYQDRSMTTVWRDVLSLIPMAVGAACAFVHWDGAYLPTWILRLVKYWLRPKKYVLRP